MKSRIRRLIPALAALWLLASGVAAAQDLTPPVITHAPVDRAVSDTSLQITAAVTDDTAVRRVVLYARSAGTSNYYAISMSVQGGEYRGIIPASLVTPGVLEYYIEAIDTVGNTSTSPAVNASQQPHRIEVVPDQTMPDVELIYPTGAVGDGTVVIVVLLKDAGMNIDPSSVRVYLDGRDVTADATISGSAVTLVVDAQELASISSLRVRVADRAGNEVTKDFKVFKRPAFAGRVEVGYLSRNGESKLAWNVFAEGGWGPFSAYAKLDSGDPMFTGVQGQPANQFRLSYDSRIVDVQVGDVVTSISRLTAQNVNHRGINALIDLGPFETTFGAGVAVHAVNGESFARRFVGLRQELDLRLISAGFNAVRLVDDPDSAAAVPVNPEQNYVLSLDFGAGLGSFKVGGEFGFSMLFPNARGNLWESLDVVGTLPQPIDEAQEILEKVPSAFRNFFPLPDPNYWMTYPPYFDVGSEVAVTVPLPLSTVEASYYRFGRDFRSLAGKAEADREGFKASWQTRRILGGVALSASYADYKDNVQALLHTMAGTPKPADAERNRFQEMAGKISYRTRSGATIDLSGERKATNPEKAVADLGVGQGKHATNTYGVDLRNYRTNFGGYSVTLGGGLAQTRFDDLVNPANDKTTTTVKASARLARGLWTYSLGYTGKREVDAGGAAVTSPTVSLGAAWARRNVTFGEWVLHRVRVSFDASLSSSRGDGIDSATTVHTLRVRVNPTENTELNLMYRVKNTEDNIAAKSTSGTTLRIGFTYSF